MESSQNNEKKYHHGRRSFIGNGLLLTAGAALSGIPVAAFAGGVFNHPPTYRVQDIIDLILKDVNVPPIADTIDTVKFGDTSQVVTGIVTTMFATVEVIEKAIALKANFIIVHEPTFFKGLDRTEKLEVNELMKKKQALLKEHQVVIWRFHDYCHDTQPDMISHGFMKKMNWLQYDKTGQPLLHIPALRLDQLVHQLKSNLRISHLRIMGNTSKTCSSIALYPGACGVQAHIDAVEKDKPDVLIIGELVEWETAEYFRDAARMGTGTALVVLGHSVSEEPGMEYFAEWLQPKIPGISVSHIASGDPFTWL